MSLVAQTKVRFIFRSHHKSKAYECMIRTFNCKGFRRSRAADVQDLKITVLEPIVTIQYKMERDYIFAERSIDGAAYRCIEAITNKILLSA